MQTTDSLTMFHLSRKDGTPVFLHPFVRRGSTEQISQDTALAGSYGREPRVESLTLLRNELYRRIENDVRDWINERRFIPRFLLSAAAFLISFLFLTIVIRDPLPIVDETVVAIVAAVVVFVAVGRRFEQSKVAGQRRVMMRSRVDGVVFSEDEFVTRLEELLHRCEEIDYKNAVESQELQQTAREIRELDPSKTGQVVSYLRELISVPPYRGLERTLRRGKEPRRYEAQIRTGVILPALVSFYYLLAKSS